MVRGEVLVNDPTTAAHLAIDDPDAAIPELNRRRDERYQELLLSKNVTIAGVAELRT